MDDPRQPLTEHLSELRRRIGISLAIVGIFFIVLFNYSERFFEILTFPLKNEMKLSMTKPYVVTAPKEAVSLVFLAPAEAFWMHMKVSFVAAVVAALPVVFFQTWKFVSPGLLERERRYLVPFLLFASGMFVLGSAFCFLVVLPFAMTFLLGYKTGTLVPMLSVGSYVDFCLKFILAFGAIFELPLVLIFLTRLGVVTTKSLARNRKYAILFAFIAAALLTPTPDAFNQMLMAVPIIILYEAGILLSMLFARRRGDAERAG